jgi:LPXTG-site transpeptidase (sortase) family protein
MLLKGTCLALLGIGIFILVQVLMPFLAFKTWEVFALDSNQLLETPKVGSINQGSGVLGVSIEDINNFPTFFSNSQKRDVPYKEFKVSIPSINIKDQIVKVDSNDFDEELAQLPGTAFPGEKGNLFISGHSSIAQFKFGKQKALFVDLPKVKKGDKIYVTALGQQFTYQIQGLKIVEPKDVSAINPPDDEGRYITLMTCVPPGFFTKRLIVLAKLENL